MPHPCLSCGACCAAFRVPIYWSEAEERAIPDALIEQIDPMRVALRVDNVVSLRCVALDGPIGVHTLCRIYAQRPSPCRELKAAWEDGDASPQCDRARARHGLPPLTPATWSDIGSD